MEVSWGTKWRGFSFADVVNADPGFADHVHKFVYKTQAHIKFLVFARSKLTTAEYAGDGQPLSLHACPVGDVVAWGSKWFGYAYLEVLRTDPNYPVWLASKFAFRTAAQDHFLAFVASSASSEVLAETLPSLDNSELIPLQLRLRDSEKELARVGKVIIKWERRLGLPYVREAKRDEALNGILNHLEFLVINAPEVQGGTSGGGDSTSSIG